ncbi:anthranilate synthase component I family protein [Acetobacter orientalis]|uniref:anthranilate synthase component I family protein n=1 Tax=Acetobacter orientalis TaxID=146474 RepID=UPI000A3CF098|nr:anthranilate synthase component I family protein [Acetobacter orientalis]
MSRSNALNLPPHVWAQELPWQDPDSLLAAWGNSPWCAFLDSGGPVEARSRWQILCVNPQKTFIVQNGVLKWGGGTSGVGTPLGVFNALRTLMPPRVGREQGRFAHLPFFGGLVGFLGYGFGMALEGLGYPLAPEAEPDCAFGFYDHAFLWDRQEQRAFAAGFVVQEQGAGAVEQRQKDVCALWYAAQQQGALQAPLLPKLHFKPDQSPQAYEHAVEKAKEFIAAGDIFQVNITGRYSAVLEKTVLNTDLYRALRHHAPAPFGAYLRCGQHYALHSTSPERFLQLTPYGAVSSRPIKGTAPRGVNAAEDAILAEALAKNEKECAENLMIVDLMRNDIGRVARIGSMRVPEFLQVERFAHVHHLVSEVQGVLAAGKDAFDVLQATVPPGSVTGAPKHRAMQIIEEVEASARGAYCGSIVRIGVDGHMESSVIIRTLVRWGQKLSVGAGGGITILSDPQKEYQEMCLKIAPLLQLFGAQP